MKNLILFAGNELCKTMFEDIAELDDWTSLDDLIYTKSNLLKLLFKLHTSVKVNRIFDLPFKSVWAKYMNPLRRYPFKKGERYHIILINPIFENYALQDFVNLQINYDVQYTLVMIDTFNTKSGHVVAESMKTLMYKKIYTFDRLDAVKYGFEYTNSMYSMLRDIKKNRPKSDLYFIGRDKGRKKLIEDIFDILTSHGCNCDFTINGVTKDNLLFGIESSRGITYRQVVNEIQSTNCILEVIQQGQTGVTLRYYEAVCYNKKLLTNNPDIVNYPHYDERFMRVYQKPSDIDVTWVKKIDSVDYGYRGEYSPINLVKWSK